MTMSPRATLIISIYQDIEALAVIFHALKMQSSSNFSILVSEDGASPQVAEFIAEQQQQLGLPLQHLSQTDLGFRKNRALNRAVLEAPNDYLIFIDGDCVPHKNFIQAHVNYAEHKTVNCGRRIELGERYSRMIRTDPTSLERLHGNLRYLMQYNALRRDQTKNIELGLYLPLLQHLSHNRDSSIVGCNFSLYRDDLLAINGFDESYTSPGIGEDSDLELRLRNNGGRMKSNKLTAIQYHLYHPRTYTVSNENMRLFNAVGSTVRCTHGIDSHRGMASD